MLHLNWQKNLTLIEPGKRRKKNQQQKGSQAHIRRPESEMLPGTTTLRVQSNFAQYTFDTIRHCI